MNRRWIVTASKNQQSNFFISVLSHVCFDNELILKRANVNIRIELSSHFFMIEIIMNVNDKVDKGKKLLEFLSFLKICLLSKSSSEPEPEPHLVTASAPQHCTKTDEIYSAMKCNY
jgi:hypothetical protein